MKQNELMIGDWVQERADQSIFKVDGHWTLYNAKDFVPVPITSEILMKNGFIKRDSSGYPEHHSFELPTSHMVFKVFGMYDTDFSFNISETALKIRYVHELQQALRLCHIDKEIQL